MEKQGHKAVAPVLDSRLMVVDRRSNWSERHAAFIAGLGTFSLHKSLITVKGKNVYEYCNNCGACIDRCPANAISEKGKDIDLCACQNRKNQELFAPWYGCGKCQTAVPCEHSRP